MGLAPRVSNPTAEGPTAEDLLSEIASNPLGPTSRATPPGSAHAASSMSVERRISPSEVQILSS